MDWERYRVEPGIKPNLAKVSTLPPSNVEKNVVKEEWFPAELEEMKTWQEKLYAEKERGLVIVLQARDAAGKDGTIKHVFTALNPQGVHVTAFKEPSAEELDRDYLWRIHKALPRRGEIGIFNRSHYEEVIVTRVHKLLDNQAYFEDMKHKKVWQDRFREINNWEEYLSENGFTVLKFFLHVSREEQAERILDRIRQPEKHWKFSLADVNERSHWDDYGEAYEEVFKYTSTGVAPWYIIPADKKWFARYLVARITNAVFRKLQPAYPELPPATRRQIEAWRKQLAEEGKTALEALLTK
ncbi:MAG: polyphosphate kinase 2 family protein [Veillonellaceae bacterium]|nr:polyphosphate kinase 2 family protein [Veillonellaceae bacterium]